MCTSRITLVLPILWTGHGAELLQSGKRDDGVFMEHPDVTQRSIQQRVGHYPKRMEGHRTQSGNLFGHRYGRTDIFSGYT